MLTHLLMNGFEGHRGADIVRDLNPLVIARIKLGGSHPESQSDLPASVKRIGKFLLTMLRTEYEHRKEPICDLTIAEANGRLREQIVQYLKSAYPFSRPYRAKESAMDWWGALDRDQTHDAQPLAVRVSSNSCSLCFPDRYRSSDLLLRYLLSHLIQWPTSVQHQQSLGSTPHSVIVNKCKPSSAWFR